MRPVLKPLRERSNKIVLKDGGRTFTTIDDVMSADGKTHPATITNIDPKGHLNKHIEFYEEE